MFASPHRDLLAKHYRYYSAGKSFNITFCPPRSFILSPLVCVRLLKIFLAFYFFASIAS